MTLTDGRRRQRPFCSPVRGGSPRFRQPYRYRKSAPAAPRSRSGLRWRGPRCGDSRCPESSWGSPVAGAGAGAASVRWCSTTLLVSGHTGRETPGRGQAASQSSSDRPIKAAVTGRGDWRRRQGQKLWGVGGERGGTVFAIWPVPSLFPGRPAHRIALRIRVPCTSHPLAQMDLGYGKWLATLDYHLTPTGSNRAFGRFCRFSTRFFPIVSVSSTLFIAVHLVIPSLFFCAAYPVAQGQAP